MTDAELIKLKEKLNAILKRIGVICQECKDKNESGEKHEEMMKSFFPSIESFPHNEAEKKEYLENIEYFITPVDDNNEVLLTASIPDGAIGELTFEIEVGMFINGKKYSHVEPIKIDIGCIVRTIADRPGRNVNFNIPEDRNTEKGKPCDPKTFPKNLWKIDKVEWQEIENFSEGDYGPVRIRTKAHQLVNVWSIEDKNAEENRRTAIALSESAQADALIKAGDAASAADYAKKAHKEARGLFKAKTKKEALKMATAFALSKGRIADASAKIAREAVLDEVPTKGYVDDIHKYLPFVKYVPLADQNKYQYVKNGDTGEKVEDYGYLLHYAKGGFTVGCIGILDEDNARHLAEIVDIFLKSGKTVNLLVQ